MQFSQFWSRVGNAEIAKQLKKENTINASITQKNAKCGLQQYLN